MSEPVSNWQTNPSYEGWSVVHDSVVQSLTDKVCAYFIRSPDFRACALVHADRVVREFVTSENYQTQENVLRVSIGESESEEDFSEVEDEQLLALAEGLDDLTYSVDDCRDGLCPDCIELYLSPDGKRIIFSYHENQLNYLFVDGKAQLFSGDLQFAEFSTDSANLFYVYRDKERQSWFVSHGEARQGSVVSSRFSEDGKHLAVLVNEPEGEDPEGQTVLLIDGEPIRAFDAYQCFRLPGDEPSHCESLHFDRSGRFLIFGEIQNAGEADRKPVVCFVDLRGAAPKLRQIPGVKLGIVDEDEQNTAFELLVYTREDNYSAPQRLSIPLH